jgi:hypothetical protein
LGDHNSAGDAEQEDLNVEIAAPIAEREGHGRAWWSPKSGWEEIVES